MSNPFQVTNGNIASSLKRGTELDELIDKEEKKILTTLNGIYIELKKVLKTS